MSNTIVRCDCCLFYQPHDDAVSTGICRRHAPKSGIWAGPGGLSAYYGDATDEPHVPNVLWPKVTSSDWCGDGVPSEVAEFHEPEGETLTFPTTLGKPTK